MKDSTPIKYQILQDGELLHEDEREDLGWVRHDVEKWTGCFCSMFCIKQAFESKTPHNLDDEYTVQFL